MKPETCNLDINEFGMFKTRPGTPKICGPVLERDPERPEKWSQFKNQTRNHEWFESVLELDQFVSMPMAY